MSGRGNKKQSLKPDVNKKWKLGGYGRRSFDDGEVEESYTITNQKRMIDSFVKNDSNIEIVDYYIDDGYSGTTFNRPDFKRMMDDIVNGSIDGIIVKDLSRLGRNHRQIGKYIEEIFPIYNLRIISINDNIDSYKNPDSISGILVPFKNLVNENYSRDISLKVRSSYATMAKEGKFVAGTPPYGYMLDPEDKHHLVINDNEAKIVKEIFSMSLKGNGRIKICKYLNDNGILCRKELQRRNKRKLTLEPFSIPSKYYWSTSTIGRMLVNETYIGNLVQLKTKRETFGANRFVMKDKEEWVRSENTHEALISKEDFYMVKKLIKINERSNNSNANKNYSIYNRKLKCADCKRAMTKQEDNRGNRNLSNYFCMSYLSISKSCSSHKIKTSVLEQLVLEAIQLQVKLVIELDKSLSKLYFKNNKETVETEYKNNMRIANLKIENLKDEKRKKYEEWKFNKMDKEEFMNISSSIDKSITEIKNNIDLYTSTYRENIKKMKKNDFWIGHYKRNRKIKRVTKEVLDELIEVIYVTKDGNIEITFKYQDEYNNLVKYLENEGEKEHEKMDFRRVSTTFG